MGPCGTINLLLWFENIVLLTNTTHATYNNVQGDCLLFKLAFCFSVKDHLGYMHLSQCHVNSSTPLPTNLHLSLLTRLLAPKRSCVLPQVISETTVIVRWPFLPWLPLCIKLNPHSLAHCLCSAESHSNSFSTLITDKHVDTRHSLVGEFSNYTLTAWANFNSDIKGNLLFL